MELRDYRLLGMTQSLCPECLEVTPAKILERQGRVYFRKHCQTHGTREDFVCSDAAHFDRLEFSVPGRIPEEFGTEAVQGCPKDCGLCTEHEQHTCIGLVEITESCNLTCPMCYAGSAPGGRHLTFEECRAAIDRLVEVEGQPEVLQISGGEPTIHPDFARILEYACAQPIDYVMINTNGIRLAHDPELVQLLVRYRERIEVYFQFDTFDETASRALRGEPLVAVKQRALEALGKAGVFVSLVTTLQPGVNDHELGAIVRFGLARPWITGVSFQPATYSGRHLLPEDLERRITFPDVIQGLEEQTGGLLRVGDFMPLPCAHPNCHSVSYLYRQGDQATPLMRFIDAAQHYDLLAGGISFTRPAARDLIERYLGRHGCCAGGNCGPQENGEGSTTSEPMQLAKLPIIEETGLGQPEMGSAGVRAVAGEFFQRAMRQELGSADLFRIMITSFLDAYNFDVRRVMKCCIHHVLPSGHVIPFCAYNTLYRDGHLPLPPLTRSVVAG